MSEKILAILIGVAFEISSETELCNNFSILKQCQFSLSKIRIHHTIKSVYSGIDQSECLTRMERFPWSTGIFCPLSWFCGMGIELMRDYKWVNSGEVNPVKEKCHIWVQNDLIDCGDLITAIYDAGILKGELKETDK